jgi:hypothetical protein
MEQKYRMLEEGETLIEGDEFHLGDNHWRPTDEAGGKAEGLQYRRPIMENQCRYRDLTHDDTIQPGDEVWVFGSGPWEPVSVSEHGQQYRNGYNRMRRPVAAPTEVIEAWQKDHMEMKRKFENLMKDWYEQRSDLADARNKITDLQKELQGKELLVKKLDHIEKTTIRLRGFREINSHDPARCIEDAASLITDLTRRLEDALSNKVIAEKERDGWQGTAAQHLRNEDFYRGIVTDIGNMFGLKARIADDGTICEGVLALRVPELVAEIIMENS